MKKLLNNLKKRVKKGQSLVEYGLILALVSVVAIAVLNTMGTHIRDTIGTVNDELIEARNDASDNAKDTTTATLNNGGGGGGGTTP